MICALLSAIQRNQLTQPQIEAEGIQRATIPQCIENGDYLVRFEILALHSAGDRGDAQFYVRGRFPNS